MAFLLLFAWASTASWAQTAVDPTGPGSDGLTTATAFQITQLGNLVWMQQRAAANQTAGKYYALMNDIDASDTANWNDSGTTTALVGFQPIGNSVSQFTGVFDGQGYRITGLSIGRPSTNYVGLFGSLGASAVVRNLELENCNVTGRAYVGVLAGANNGAITSCTVTGSVTSPGTYTSHQFWSYAGGLAGNNSGSIAASHSAVTVNCVGQYVGGLIGYSSVGPITDSDSTGTVTGQSDSVGGLVGAHSSGTITNCFATGAVTGGASNIGGLIGYSSSSSGVASTISGCHAAGAVTGAGVSTSLNYSVGGLVGYFTNNGAPNTITACYATGAVTGTRGAYGGLVGEFGGNGTVSNCFATGSVTCSGSSTDAGGLVGVAYTGDTITNSFAAGPVTTSGFGGGLVGFSNYATITNSYSTGVVAGSSMVGGLFGFSIGGTVTGCYWDTQTSGQTTSPSGAGKTTAQMKQQATFAGWDFSTVWGIVEGESYPYLRFSPPPFHLSITVQGSGTVALSPAGGVYDAGTVVTLTALPASDSVFKSWSGGVTDAGTSTTTITMDSPKFVTALFKPTQEIRTLSELQAVASSDRAGDYVLMNDIDASDTANWNDGGTATDILEGFQPIASAASPFTGTFDGNGFKITGLTIRRSTTDNVGLFGYIGTGAKIRNLGIEGCAVTGQNCTGALAGNVDGSTVTNCYVVGSVVGLEKVGGLIGYSLDGSTVSHSSASGSAKATYGRAGGLVGTFSGGAAADCFTSTTVTGVYDLGGLIGELMGGTIVTNASATGPVSGTGAAIGGLVGDIYISGTISDSHATGAVVGSEQAFGGLIGRNDGTITRCYATGTVLGLSSTTQAEGAGGLVGTNSGTVNCCFATGAVTATSPAGGLVGANGDLDAGTILNSYATGAVTNLSVFGEATGYMGYAGGLVGANIGTIVTCFATGAVTGSASHVGGLVGGLEENLGTVTASYWDTQTSGKATSPGGGTGAATAQMRQQGTFLPAGTAAGQWDFTGVWGIQGSYPYLRAFPVHTLTYTAVADGSIAGAPSLVLLTNDGGDGAPVTAVPDTGYHFVRWSDDLTSNPRTDTNIVADVTVTAEFAIDQYSLSYMAGPHGSLTGATSQTVSYLSDGTQVTAVPNVGYHFTQWNDGLASAARIDHAVTHDTSATASFAIDRFTLTYWAGANGSISGATSQTLNFGADGTAVTAVPAAGYHFIGWSDGVLTAARTDRGVAGNLTLTASFAINLYSLAYAAGPGGSVDGATSQTVAFGHSGTAVTAQANTGWYFVDWSDGSTANPRTDANVTANIAVTAHFRQFYEIRTLAELQDVATGDLDGYYTLKNDIDASATANWNDSAATSGTLVGFRPIGSLASPFRGVFDGAGHRILGLFCAPATEKAAALFGCIGARATVKDLGLEGGSVAGGSDFAGGLAGANFGTITDCFAAIEVTGTGLYAGGLVGQNYGAILNSYAAGDVGGTLSAAGGLTGSNAGTVDRCYATGEVSGSAFAGGLSGETTGTITNSYWDADATGQAASAGGASESTDAMRQQATFQPGGGSAAGDWDFATVWGIPAAGGYPFLRAIETTATARQVIVQDIVIPRGQQGQVPVALLSLGNENSLSFSIQFDPAKLTFDGAVAGGDLPAGATITQDTSHPGQVGLLVGLPSGEVFAAGNRDFLHLSFTAGSTLEAAAVTFRGVPAAKGIGGAQGESLVARWVSGAVSVTDPQIGYEADVASRPGGDGHLTAADWTQIGRFVVGLDTPTTGSEFQRADCAPRATMGDGRLSATDWTQAGRYVVGSDPLTVAGGPTAPLSDAEARALAQAVGAAKARTSTAATAVSVVSQTVQSTQPVTLPVNLTARGTENALTFSLTFDPSQLTYVSAVRGTGVPAASTFTINDSQAAQGRIGVLIGNGTNAFAAGTAQLMQVSFAAAAVTAQTVAQVGFGDTPALREVSDTTANALATTWTGGTVTIDPVPLQTGDFLTRRVKSTHAEQWDAAGAQIGVKDAYSFSAKMQLPAASLASISNATTLTLVLGDDATSGAAHVLFECELASATKSTLAGHPTAKKPKDPTRGGAVTFVAMQPGSPKKARIVSLKWAKTGLLTVTVLGTPAPASWTPASPAARRVSENVADLCGAQWPAGAATGVAIPAFVQLHGVFADADTLTCAGKKKVTSSDGGDLVGWSVAGK